MWSCIAWSACHALLERIGRSCAAAHPQPLPREKKEQEILAAGGESRPRGPASGKCAPGPPSPFEPGALPRVEVPEMSATSSTLSLETTQMIARKEGGVGWMIFNNPERRNAMSVEMREAIPVILGDFDDDPGVRAVVMTGAGDKAFVSGADISQFERSGRSADHRRLRRPGRRVGTAFAGLEKPLIAMIRDSAWWRAPHRARGRHPDRVRGRPVRGPGGAARSRLRGRRHRALMDFVGPAVASEILFSAGGLDAQPPAPCASA